MVINVIDHVFGRCREHQRAIQLGTFPSVRGRTDLLALTKAAEDLRRIELRWAARRLTGMGHEVPRRDLGHLLAGNLQLFLACD